MGIATRLFKQGVPQGMTCITLARRW